MKKWMLSLLICLCLALGLAPCAAGAELPSAKRSVPTTFDTTVDLTKQNRELKITDSKTYLIKGSADPNWYFQYRIKIDGKNITPHIFLDGVRLQAPKDGPAIELYGGASACLYFIGGDSELIGAENFAALQKNKTEGYLRVLVKTGTKLTCKGGRYGAGIGGSKVGVKSFSQGHGVNLYFGNFPTDTWGGEIWATSGAGGAGIGGGKGGDGRIIYVYSGKLTALSVSQGAGIGGGQGGPGRYIYIWGGTVHAGSWSGGAGIGSGDQDGRNAPEDAHHIEISGGSVIAWSNYAGAGIGGGRYSSGHDISIIGGEVTAQGYWGAGIGGGMNGGSGNILIRDTTLTAQSYPLYPNSSYHDLPAAAVGRGSDVTHWMPVMQNQEYLMHIEENIKIGASDGKSVWLSATGWQWRRSQGTYEWGWGTTTEFLIPNEYGRVDLQRLSLPYACNYGRVIGKLELRCYESTCSHELGWTDRDGCHIWACVKCGARDPAAENSKQNGVHTPADWTKQTRLCSVCGLTLDRDTTGPVFTGIEDGKRYLAPDGGLSFTVEDVPGEGETASGLKQVTIDDEVREGSSYTLPADGNEHTVCAEDYAGNQTRVTVTVFRKCTVIVVNMKDGSTVCEEEAAQGERLVLQLPISAGMAATLYDEQGNKIQAGENGGYDLGVIQTDRRLRLSTTQDSELWLRLEITGLDGQAFRSWQAQEEAIYVQVSRNGSYAAGQNEEDARSFRLDTLEHAARSWYIADQPYSKDKLQELDEAGEITWSSWKSGDSIGGKDGIWYLYAKASRDGKTCYISSPPLVFDRSVPHAEADGRHLTDGGLFWGGLRFTATDDVDVAVRDNGAPLQAKDGLYTIQPDRAGRTEADDPRHTIVLTDACGNRTSYTLRVLKNELEAVLPLPAPTPFANGTALADMLPEAVEVETTRSRREGGTVLMPVVWDLESAAYDPAEKAAQRFSVSGLLKLPQGVTARIEGQLHLQLTLEVLEAEKYPLSIETENGTVTVLNAENPQAPEFYAGDEVRFTVQAARGYVCQRVLVNGQVLRPEADGEYRFVQPAAPSVIHAEFRKIILPETGSEETPTGGEKVPVEETPPQTQFPDVGPEDWFHDAVNETVSRGLLQGTGAGFAPQSPVSRAMVWMVLARLDGVKTAPAAPWYALAREWAMTEGLTDGTRPDAAVTREELATLLYRYEVRAGGGFTGSWYFPLRFPDAALISAYADEALHWCVMKGILTGRADGRLDPGGTATRAEFAAMLCRFLKLKEQA